MQTKANDSTNYQESELSNPSKGEEFTHPKNQQHSQQYTTYREPQTELEVKVATLLNQLLDKGPIGLDDDFFRMGGNSLMAVRFTAIIFETYGVRIQPRRFYESPTVAGLVAVIEGLLQEQ